MNPSPLIASFSAAYAEAVIAHLRSGTSHAVHFDRKRGAFGFYELAAGSTPDDVDCHIGQGWDWLCGTVDAESDPSKPNFSEATLAAAIISALGQRDDVGDFVEALRRGGVEEPASLLMGSP